MLDLSRIYMKFSYIRFRVARYKDIAVSCHFVVFDTDASHFIFGNYMYFTYKCWGGGGGGGGAIDTPTFTPKI